MKKIILLVILFTFSMIPLLNTTQAAVCNYESKIVECLENQDSPRVIEDFICIQWSPEKVAYQIILDDKFKELDKELDIYLKALEDSKGYYFGADKKENYIEATNDIEKYIWRYGYFETQYKNLCKNTGEESIINEVLKCFDDDTTVDKSHEFLRWWDCEKIYRTKLAISRDAAYNTLKLNKQQISKDSHKVFAQQLREQFDELLDILRVNIGYIERIWMKWPSKTRIVH